MKNNNGRSNGCKTCIRRRVKCGELAFYHTLPAVSYLPFPSLALPYVIDAFPEPFPFFPRYVY